MAGARGQPRSTPPEYTAAPKKQPFEQQALRYFFSKRVSLALVSGLWILRAADGGELQSWVATFKGLCETPLWAITLAALASSFFFRSSNWRILRWAWLVIVLACLVMRDMELFSSVLIIVQLLQLMSQMLVNFVDFASCSLRSWMSLLAWCTQGSVPGLKPVDWIAAVMVTLLLLRYVYTVVRMSRDRRLARSLFEIDFQRALQESFRVAFEKDFGAVNSNPPPMRQRSFASIQAAGTISEEELQRLEEIHAVLLVSRSIALQKDELPDSLEFTVRRSHLLDDSWEALLQATTDELLAPEIMVTFAGESDGNSNLVLDWFSSLGSVMVDDAGSDAGSSFLALGKSSKMLIPRPVPKSSSRDVEEDERLYRNMRLLGRFLALGVVNGGRPLPMPLSTLVCKYIVGDRVDMADMRWLDPTFFEEHVAPLVSAGGLAGVEARHGKPLTFVSVPTELRPEPEELEPGGATTTVTNENLSRYLQLLCDSFLCSEIRQELQFLLKGFWDVLPLQALQEAGVSVGDLSIFLSDVAFSDAC